VDPGVRRGDSAFGQRFRAGMKKGGNAFALAAFLWV
jgi:hypothetical protein